MGTFLSSNISKSFFPGLLSVSFPPSMYLCLELPGPRCRTLDLDLLNFMGFAQGATGWHQDCYDELKLVFSRILVLCFVVVVHLNGSRSSEVCCLSTSCVQL